MVWSVIESKTASSKISVEEQHERRNIGHWLRGFDVISGLIRSWYRETIWVKIHGTDW